MGLPKRRQWVHGVVGKEMDARLGYKGSKRSAVLSVPGWLYNGINSNAAQCSPDIDCWFSMLAFLILPTNMESSMIMSKKEAPKISLWLLSLRKASDSSKYVRFMS